jgi:hypothetical protein
MVLNPFRPQFLLHPSVVSSIGATSPLVNSSKKGSQMAPLSFLERGDKEACDPWEGRGTH